MTAVELLGPGEATPDNETWHELRRAGITASEIAVVMGLSPYDSPFNLYWSKVNDWRWEGNEFTSAGRHLEDAIAEWWALEHGGEPDDPNLRLRPAGLYAHPDRPWQLATPDRIVKRSAAPERPGVFRFTALLECKWVAYSWDGWGEPGTDEIPVYYRCQGLWQADVMGVDEVHFAALGPGGFRSYLVRRDEADLELMRKAGAEFHARLLAGDPPPLDSHTATIGALKKLHPTVGEGDVEVEPVLALDYFNARMAKASAEKSVALCEAQIRDALGETYSRATYGGRTLASRSVFETSRIDSKRLKAERPEIAAEYTTTTTVDKLTPGRVKRDA